jgi:hypothetical protein
MLGVIPGHKRQIHGDRMQNGVCQMVRTGEMDHHI